MGLTEEEIEKQMKYVREVAPALGQFLETKAQEFFKDKRGQKNFILCCCVNLLGNMAMQWSEENIYDKVLVTSCAVENLLEWFKISIADYRIKKEAH